VYAAHVISHVPIYNLQLQITAGYTLQVVTLGKVFKMLVAVRQQGFKS